MKDLRQSQLSQMHRERRALIASKVPWEKFIIKCRAKEYPDGSVYAWADEKVFGPIGSVRSNGNAA